MNVPAQTTAESAPYGGWPGNELEQVLVASLGVPGAGGRIVETLGRATIWVPLPKGGGPESMALDLPAVELDGQAYVPVFSSQQQLLGVMGTYTPFAEVAAIDFARGLPAQLGILLNPEGTVTVPLPPPAVAELCRAGRTVLDGPGSGGRVRLREPDWQVDPVDFLSAAAEEFAVTGLVRTARRCLAEVEDQPPSLFVGVELSDPAGGEAVLDALGRALGRAPVAWPVNLILLDVAQDPVADWLRARVRPFHAAAGY
ncbi:enhanced serine sensitivity protein SseB [Streptomyces sp. SID11385]|uniref:enhanced serine sensitivity protein SseB n=1 Tax=Streptomyces sp. SID11385 TaxID=2706031 RepID=UPI0013C70666|nr:enhanced serine sensitivity protein SseB [Streptomyces sp. SID11385]NEA39941.1 enhanced serine sensitivity protein SseB [Streptomyces sp. SID11385]